MSLTYGEQGRYSLAEALPPAEPAVPSANPVRFRATAASGLPPSAPAKASAAAHEGSAALGPGACVFDFDGDGRADVFLPRDGDRNRPGLYRNLGHGRFENVTQTAGLEAAEAGIACAAGDYDNDGRPDLAVTFPSRLVLYHNEGRGKFRDVTAEAGIRVAGSPLGLTFLDYDHDGDLDLYVAVVDNPEHPSQARNQLWRNNGNGAFTDVTEATGLAGKAPSIGMVASDWNNDRAVDLVVTGWGKAPTIFTNPREGQFVAQEPWSQTVAAPTAGVAALDFNHDGWMDLVFTHGSAPGVSLWRNVEGKRFEPVALPPTGWKRAWGVAALDYDNDGWIDIAAVGESENGAEIRLFRNRGPQGFQDVSRAVGLDRIKLDHPRALVAADYHGDGAAGLLVTQADGSAVLLRNEGGNRNSWLRLRLKGLADNKSALGAKVEIFAGALQQKWEVAGASGYLSQGPAEVIAGLGKTREADVVRILWPTGVLQDEVQLAARQPHGVDEIDRRGSSCPILFAWNGDRYEFIADVIGAGVIGHWVGPGERNLANPTEYVKVEGTRVRPRHGRLSFRFAEPMEEVNYLDQVRLLAVDHPRPIAVFSADRFLSRPPFPEFKLITSRHPRPPLGAWDQTGRNVLPQLLSRDHRYVTGFRELSFPGLAEMHYLELDLGRWEATRPLRLLMHGFIEYFTANSMYAAWQAGLQPIAPYVEALDEHGRWVKVVDDMGFPAGLPRTMVVDLSGRLPQGARRLRIATNLRIYWDQVLIDNSDGGAPSFAPHAFGGAKGGMRITEAPLAAARLHFHGYPRPVERYFPGDLDYIYEQASATGPYARHVGSYTRYGDVLELLRARDDRFVIFGSGEEVELEFDPSVLPALPAGWTRDYFFFADGFVKDMDFYEAEAQTVDPLPFHSMSGYPYAGAEPYFKDDQALDSWLAYNTRYESGRGISTLRFNYSDVWAGGPHHSRRGRRRYDMNRARRATPELKP